MRIGDQIQISGKKVTPLKSKQQIPSSKKVDSKGKLISPKGQILASRTQDQTTYFLLKTDNESSPKWEVKEKIIDSHKAIIQKYERQQKAFHTSQQQQVLRPSIVIQNSDESDEDKNKLNGKRKLCIGGKAPVLNSSGKKVCNENTKEGNPQNNNGNQSLFSSKLQEMKSRLHESNALHNENQQKNNNINNPHQSNYSKNANNETLLLVKRNNLFDSTNYYNTSKQEQNTMINNLNPTNNSENNNQKISHRLLFDSQPVHPQINPKNQQKLFEKQVQKEKQLEQQLPVIQENSKNFSDIENISHLNNSISEEQKSDLPAAAKNKNQPNNINNLDKLNNKNQSGSTLAKSSSFGTLLFKRDDLQIAKSKSLHSDPTPQIQNNKSQQQLKGLQKLLDTNSPSKNFNIFSKNAESINNNTNKNEQNQNNSLQKIKSSSSEEGKQKKSVDKSSSSKNTQKKLNDSKVEKKPSNDSKKAFIPNLESEGEDQSQDDIILKKKDFGKYIQQVFGFNKQTPKSSTIKNVYSPSKSPMIDLKKNKLDTQSQYQDSQIEGPPKDGPLNEVIQQNLQRLNEMIQNSEKKKLNKSGESPNNNQDDFVSAADENNFISHHDVSQMDTEEKFLHQYEKERADYSQFQNRLIQEYNEQNGYDKNNDDEFDDQSQERYVLQLEKGTKNQKPSNEILTEKSKSQTGKSSQPKNIDKSIAIEQETNKKQLFQSPSQQEESKQGESKKQYAPIYQEKKIQPCNNTQTENIIPSGQDNNLPSTQAESFYLNSEVQKKIPLPDQGHFCYGDKAKKILACRPRDNDINMEIEWEPRSDGKIPEKSTLSSKIVREYNHDILIDFYESKIKFTYKNAVEKKKQTQNESVKQEFSSPVQNQQ